MLVLSLLLEDLGLFHRFLAFLSLRDLRSISILSCSRFFSRNVRAHLITIEWAERTERLFLFDVDQWLWPDPTDDELLSNGFVEYS